MTGAAHPVPAARVAAYIAAPGARVLELYLGKPLTTESLAARLHRRDSTLVLGATSLAGLVRERRALGELMLRLDRGGRSPHCALLPGFFLFVDGALRAWESGLPRGRDAKELVRAALFGTLWSALTEDPRFFAVGIGGATRPDLEARVYASFERVLVGERADARTQGTRDRRDPLTKAYELLGVSPQASDREVQRAWREKRLAFHPDRAANDPIERARRTRISTEINAAWDLIRKQRARARSAH